MRALFLTNLFPPYELGGYEQYCQEMAARLESLGHEVCVLTSRHGLAGPTTRPALGPTVIRRLYLQNDLEYYSAAHFFLRRSIEERANLRELRRVAEEFAPDVVVVWGMWQLSLSLPLWAEQQFPGRVVYYIASYWPTDVDPHTAYWRLPARRAYTEQLKRPLRAVALAQLRRQQYPPSLGFDHAVCVSAHVRDVLVASGALPAGARVQHLGIDPRPHQRFQAVREGSADGRLRLLYFGRLIADKGVHTAIEALEILVRRGLGERVDLTILGTGHPEYEAHLRTLVALLGLESSVRFIGKVPGHEIPRMLQDHDVFLSTSTWAEPFARTVLEAMMSGLVVVASDVGGTREVFRHYDESLLFRAGDAAALADRVARLVNDQGLRSRLARLGRQVVLDRFTLDATAGVFETYLRDIVQRAEANRTTAWPDDSTLCLSAGAGDGQ